MVQGLSDCRHGRAYHREIGASGADRGIWFTLPLRLSMTFLCCMESTLHLREEIGEFMSNHHSLWLGRTSITMALKLGLQCGTPLVAGPIYLFVAEDTHLELSQGLGTCHHVAQSSPHPRGRPEHRFSRLLDLLHSRRMSLASRPPLQGGTRAGSSGCPRRYAPDASPTVPTPGRPRLRLSKFS